MYELTIIKHKHPPAPNLLFNIFMTGIISTTNSSKLFFNFLIGVITVYR